MKLRVGVIFGGRSGEHEVSLNSANSVINALDRDKFDVVPIGITKTGRWLAGAKPSEVLAQGAFDPKLVPVALVADPSSQQIIPISDESIDLGALDVVFTVLHGTFGEDGTIQGLLELANIPYVGSGVLGSAAGMDKIIMKAIFAQAGLPQARFMAVSRKRWETSSEEVVKELETAIGYPCFVKPANLGSSVGISKSRNREELYSALNLAAQFDRRLVVEEFVDGREIEVAVMGNDEPMASLPGEILPCNEFYDYKAKYIDGNSGLVIPAELSEQTTKQIREFAVKAFLSLDCAGLARADFFVRRSDGAVLINEVNTMPGFTQISMYPKLWEATGIPYTQLLSRLIELAIERHTDRNRNKTSFDI